MRTKKPKRELTPAQSMLQAKEKLIVRLEGEIEKIQADAILKIEKVKGRILIAQTLLNALKKGTLKP